MARKKSSKRKYSPKASKAVEREMHEFKRGKLKSGRSGRKVKNPKQAIAIGLSEARERRREGPREEEVQLKKIQLEDILKKEELQQIQLEEECPAARKKSSGRKKSSSKNSSS